MNEIVCVLLESTEENLYMGSFRVWCESMWFLIFNERHTYGSV